MLSVAFIPFYALFLYKTINDCFELFRKIRIPNNFLDASSGCTIFVIKLHYMCPQATLYLSSSHTIFCPQATLYLFLSYTILAINSECRRYIHNCKSRKCNKTATVKMTRAFCLIVYAFDTISRITICLYTWRWSEKKSYQIYSAWYFKSIVQEYKQICS